MGLFVTKLIQLLCCNDNETVVKYSNDVDVFQHNIVVQEKGCRSDHDKIS